MPFYLIVEFYLICLSISLAKGHPQVRTFSNRGSPGMMGWSNNKSDYILSYLAGLLEGDGHFNTPKKLKSLSGTARVAAIETVFASKDRPSAELLQSLFGGRLYDHPSKNLTRWIVQDIKSVTNIINLINGKFRTPKINSLYDMIDFLNNRFPDLKIVKQDLDQTPLFSSSWLSGFIDSDGHFFVRLNKNSVSCGFELVQACISKKGYSKKNIMSLLAELFQIELKERNKAYCKGKNQYYVTWSKLEPNKIMYSYLSNYPLFSSKFLNSQDCFRVMKLIEEKVHKTEAGKDIINGIKNNMNNRRTVFVWDHLQKFYSMYK